MLAMTIDDLGAYKLLRVEEDITHENVQDFSTAIDGLIESGHTEIVLDLSKVPYVTSKGLGAIVASYTVLKKFGGNLVVLCPQEDVLRSFSITKIDRILDIAMDRDEALRLLEESVEEARRQREADASPAETPPDEA